MLDPVDNPVMLARRVTTLDVLSGGRAKLGLGLGWSCLAAFILISVLR